MTGPTLIPLESLPEVIPLVLCGMFARSNMGLALPTRDEVGWAKQDGITRARASVKLFCQAFTECDEHEAMFAAEGHGGTRLRATGASPSPAARLLPR